MIPRYQPTYGYLDLWRSLTRCNRLDCDMALRRRIASFYKVNYVFLLESARVALYVLLKAYNRSGGVLMPAYNCIVVPEAVCYAGYKPVFTDIDLNSLSMNVDSIRASMSSDISAILLTHLFGIPIDIDPIMKAIKSKKILVVEDAAPAIGAEYDGKIVGCTGDAAIISFQATKVISGETGGALLTNDGRLAKKIENILGKAAVCNKRQRLFVTAFARKMVLSSWAYALTLKAYHMLRNEEMYEIIPYKSKMPRNYMSRCSDFSSALVEIQMDRLKWNLDRRRAICKIYSEELAGNPIISVPKIPERCAPSWIQFPIMVNDKKAFYKYMRQYNIDLSWTYKYSCAESFKLSDYPNAQKAAQTVIGLPTYPSITDDQAHYICEKANRFIC